MPITYRIDREKRRLLTKGTGTFSMREVQELRERLRTDPDFDPTFWHLADFSDYDPRTISPDEVIELAAENVVPLNIRRAIVASNPLSFGMARVFAAHRISRGETGIRVFPTTREAEAWLDGAPEEEDSIHQKARKGTRA